MMKRKEGSYLTAGTIGRFVFTALMVAAYLVTYAVFAKNPQYADQYCEVTKSIAMILSGAMSYVYISPLRSTKCVRRRKFFRACSGCVLLYWQLVLHCFSCFLYCTAPIIFVPLCRSAWDWKSVKQTILI